ncbi:MAG: hypothetical protein HC802_15470 [Caldilineaceae bacterium]|nr:hypothetical protein [Caldilineaceae bacterium]
MIAFVLGAMLLFDAPGVEMPWPTILLLALSLGGFTIWAGGKALAAQRRPIRTGSEALVGQMARAKGSFQAGEEGSVFLAGEWWNAELETGEVAAGDQVEVVGRAGYTLQVRRTA